MTTFVEFVDTKRAVLIGAVRMPTLPRAWDRVTVGDRTVEVMNKPHRWRHSADKDGAIAWVCQLVAREIKPDAPEPKPKSKPPAKLPVVAERARAARAPKPQPVVQEEMEAALL